jgi:hypothetical protein
MGAWRKSRGGYRTGHLAGGLYVFGVSIGFSRPVGNYVPRPQQGKVRAPETAPVAVTAHGALAVLTMALVLLAALGVGTWAGQIG